MADHDVDSLLAVPLAALLTTPMDADGLADAVSGPGLTLAPARAAALLDRLASLGLARVDLQEGDEPAYVATSLGQRIAGSVLTAEPGLTAGLEELERLRSDLLATIGHELRTPLTSIRTSVGLLLDPGLQPSDEQRQQLLVTIARSADRVQQLLAELLDFARLRSGAVELEKELLDGRDVAREVVASLDPLVRARSQRLAVDLPPHPVVVRGDRRRLEQALLNLASNAQKFTPSGGELRVHLVEDGDLARWSVTDEGPGIGAEEQSRLFERFFVGRSDRVTRGRGVGLGLPTALAIAQAHGGTIEVDSEVGRGSTFSLAVPRAEP